MDEVRPLRKETLLREPQTRIDESLRNTVPVILKVMALKVLLVIPL